tara:strand:- start:130 stop:342 length:213 start_codon:yes stop_codon:yes gene_type:complete
MSKANARKRSLNNAGDLIPDGEQETYVISNPLADQRTVDETTPDLDEVTRALSTLLRDLDEAGILKATNP